jgi:tRNA/rRNA methyltransferase
LIGVRVVLVRPREPGNVGAAARAVANMGLSGLTVVASDRTVVAHPRAARMAAGGLSILESTRIVPSLGEALSDTVLAAGFTARPRERIEPALAPLREAAPRVVAAARSGPVALVFGPEDHGLINEDLDLCTLLITIPADDRYPVLNLAASVILAGYEISRAWTEPDTRDPVRDPLASIGDLERLFGRFNEVLVRARFLGRRERQGMLTLRGMLGRAALQKREYRFLMGALDRICASLLERQPSTVPLGNGGPLR